MSPDRLDGWHGIGQFFSTKQISNKIWYFNRIRKVLTCDMKIQHFITHTFLPIWHSNGNEKQQNSTQATVRRATGWKALCWNGRRISREKMNGIFRIALFANNHELLRQYFSIGFPNLRSIVKTIRPFCFHNARYNCIAIWKKREKCIRSIYCVKI